MANNNYAEVVAPAAYAADPSLATGFTPDYWIFTWISGGDAYYSFDGINNHGRIRATFPVQLTVESKAEKVWIRQVGGAATIGVSVATRI